MNDRVKEILIVGAKSYIGTSFETYMEKYSDKYNINTIDVKKDTWMKQSFSKYDVILHVAGIAHKKETNKNAYLYYDVNEKLAVNVAKKAKREGVKQFIILSSMSVYGIQTGYIKKDTIPNPKSHYGISKYMADLKIEQLSDCNFKVAILRPPMVYGNGCKGNYQKLHKFVLETPIFVSYKNQRSMIFIGNLCSFIKNIIDDRASGLFFPQNKEYVCTSEMVSEIAMCNNKKIKYIAIFNPLIKRVCLPFVKKIFGNLVYEKVDIVDEYDFKSSIELTENHRKFNWKSEFDIEEIQKKMLEILVYFCDFCKEHNLKFVLAGGTCLGAVRHKGFIPWDDDVDVFMLRDDYEKLKDLWDRYADIQHFSCVKSDEKINIHHSATEIKDNYTTFINNHSKDLDINQGLMIDVIPLDYVGTNKWKKKIQYVNALIYCCFNFQRLPEHKGKIVYVITKLALSLVRTSKMRYKIWKNAEKNVIRNGSVDSKKVASFGEGFSIMKQEIPVEWIINPRYLEFERKRMPVIKEYDKWLTMAYGDYMQLPPEEDRVFRHDLVYVDLNNSYKKYKGKYYCTEKK